MEEIIVVTSIIEDKSITIVVESGSSIVVGGIGTMYMTFYDSYRLPSVSL